MIERCAVNLDVAVDRRASEPRAAGPSASEFHHLNFTANPGPVIAPGATASKAAKAKPATAKTAAKPAAATGPAKDPGRIITRPQPGRDPRTEVRHFLATVGAAGGFKKGDLRPVLDLEESQGLSSAQVLEWARGFVRAIHDALGVRPIIYTGHFWREQVTNPADDLGCPLWLAAYVKDPGQYIPRAWKANGLSLWQHTETGRSPGITGPCDLNRFHGPASRYKALRIP